MKRSTFRKLRDGVNARVRNDALMRQLRERYLAERALSLREVKRDN